MKSIHTLIPDIYDTLKQKGGFSHELTQQLSIDLGARLSDQFYKREERPTLRLSQMGPRCPCALWNSIHHPELAEALPPWAEIKYAFGHIIEALTIALTKASGHLVEGEQDEVSVDGVVGHRDCVIDGCVVDVKSSSSPGFIKFKNGQIRNSDDFGYLDQLDGYLVGSLLDPIVKVKDKGYLLVIDKQLGHMCLYEHHLREDSIRERIKLYKEIIGRDQPPPCTCRVIPDGESGNLKLDTKASYSLFRHCCFPGLRTFRYAKEPVYLTKVVRKPDVPEINREGKTVYH